MLKEIEGIIKESFGEDFVGLIAALKKRKNFSEFKLAEKINKDVNYTRSLLYRLLHKSLVSFVRKKDKKHGWYICYWTFEEKNFKNFINWLYKERIKKLKEQIKEESINKFFMCGNRCLRLDFDQAADVNFKCPECGKLMEQEEVSKKIKEIKERIEKLKKAIKFFKSFY